MVTLIYRGITIFVLVLVIWNTLEGEDIRFQATGALVAIPLLLRILMIK